MHFEKLPVETSGDLGEPLNLVTGSLGTDLSFILYDRRACAIEGIAMRLLPRVPSSMSDYYHLRGDRWDPFASEGPIFTAVTRGFRSVLRLGDTLLEWPKSIQDIRGRMAVEQDGVTLFDAGKGKLNVVRTVDGESLCLSTSTLLDDNVIIMSNIGLHNQLMFDMRTSVVTREQSTNSYGVFVIANCKLFHARSTHGGEYYEGLRFEKAVCLGRPVIRITSRDYIQLYSWHPACDKLVALTFTVRLHGCLFNIYVVNCRTLTTHLVWSAYEKDNSRLMLFLTFLDGLPTICRVMSDGEIAVLV